MVKRFQKVQKLFAIYGIVPNQHPFTWRHCLTISTFGLAIISSVAYCVYEAKTFQEYADSIFMASILASGMTIFTFGVLRMRLFFYCFNEADRIIDDSELKFE